MARATLRRRIESHPRLARALLSGLALRQLAVGAVVAQGGGGGTAGPYRPAGGTDGGSTDGPSCDEGSTDDRSRQ
jgi:hypothetical protein